MLKFKKMNGGGESPQGFASAGNVLHRYWLSSLLLILIPVLAGFSYLLIMREQAIQDERIQLASDSVARLQTESVHQLFRNLEERLQAAASSPLALAAIASRDPEDVAVVEKAIMDYFPGVTSIRLITIGELGTAGLEGSNLGLRNHIEVDLLRRTGDAQETMPESYQFEGTWLTSIADLVEHPRRQNRRAVILATFDNQVIASALAAAGTERGRSSLQQIYRKGSFTRADEIAFAGNGGAERFQSSDELYEGKWSLVFTPSALMLNELKIVTTPVTVVLLVILVAVLIAFVAMLLLYQRALNNEIEKISAAAETKSDVELGIPQLLPLARQLRRATLRSATKLGAKQRKKIAAAAAGESTVEETLEEEEDEIDTEATEAPAANYNAPSIGEDFPTHVFRAYDIRGIAGSELDEELVEAIGRALGTLAGEQKQQAFVVGCDGRSSSPAIKTTLVKALLESGRDVLDIGIVPTPLVHFANNTLNIRSGVMVTGSHNPPEYNGLKITLGGKPLAGEALQGLLERIAAGKFSSGAGRLGKKDIVGDYIEAVVGDMAIAAPLKIVLDAGNGVAGAVAPRLFEEIGCEAVPLYCEVDGSFPNHHPDPSVDANLADLQAKVVEVGADFGVAFDGDGDRLVTVTAEGEIVRTDKLLMLYAQDVVSRNPGADVVFDVKCSRHLTQLISRHGGRPILWKTGHSFMREKVMETNALLGGEFSGHIFFGERWYGFDDGMYAAARLAEIVSSTGVDLAGLLSEYPDTEGTPEIRIPVPEEEKFELMSRIESQTDFSPGKVNNIDGVRVDYNDGWGLVRASNTMPALIARFEAHDTDALERIKQQFREQISNVEPGLDLGF